jgi:hypothetical protein
MLIVKFRWINIVVFAVLIGMSVPGLKQIQFDSSSDNWFLDDDPMKAAEDRFKDIFGNNDFVAVMIEVDDVFTPEVLAKIRELGRELKEKIPFSDEILSVTDCEFTIGDEDGMEIIDLVPREIPQSPEAMERIRRMALSKPALVNKLVSDDSRQSWIILRLKSYPEGWRNERHEGADMVIGRKTMEIIRQDQYRVLNPHGSGLPVISAEKMKFFKNEMARTMKLSLAATIAVLLLALHSVTGVVYPLLTAVGAIIITFGMQGHLGVKIDPGMVLVPVYLGLAVSIGYSIHIFNFFQRRFARTGDRREAVLFAVEESGWPIFFTALTTIGALISFRFIDVKTIRWVGMTASFLVAVVFLMVVVMIPSLLALGKDRRVSPTKMRLRRMRFLEGCMERLGRRVLRHSRAIMLVFMLIVAVCAVGLSRFEVSFDIRRSMGLKIPYVAMIDYVGHSKVGSLYSYDLTLTFTEQGQAKDPEVLKKFDALIREVQGYPLTKKVSSLVDIVKDMNQVLHQGDPAYYKIPETREMIAQLLLLYENAGGVEAEKWVDYDYQRLRLMVELGDYNSREAKRELLQLKASATELFPDVEVGMVGAIAQFTVMQDVVSMGQVYSFGIAMVVIALLMMLVFGSFKTGLIAMLPNIAPALAVGGIMGWYGIPLDLMTITIMPMLLGLAVDDTIHFINHSQLEFERTRDYEESMKKTFSSIGVALLMTSVVITANFSVYVTSVAKVYIHLGILTGIGIMTALLTDYCITPVLLVWAKPFGKSR